MALLDSDLTRIHEYNVKLSNQRLEALISNVGSAEIKNYRRVDVDEETLALFLAMVQGGATAPEIQPPKVSEDKRAKPVGANGSTVDVRKEMAYINETSLSQRYSMHTLNKSFRAMHKILE